MTLTERLARGHRLLPGASAPEMPGTAFWSASAEAGTTTVDVKSKSIYLRPCSVRMAIPFVRKTHRRLPSIQGAMWAIALMDDGEVVGVALVGWPARMLMRDGGCLAVLRVAVREGFPNGCSMLYGACSRAARAMGADNLVTYTHGDETGASLKASNWIDGGMTDGGEHTRLSRQRKPAIDPSPKRRWWAPWSSRARACQTPAVEPSP